MTVAEAESEYLKALRLGQKECAMLRGKGQNPFPLVLDQILGGGVSEGAQDIGTLEIPIERIVGVKSAGRISAFLAGFFPAAGLRVGICDEVDGAVSGAPGGRGHPRPYYLL